MPRFVGVVLPLPVLVVMLIGCQPAPPLAVVVNGPEAMADLQHVRRGSTHVVVFAVENPGPRALVIDSVRGDCDCITAVDPPADLPPGETTDVVVRFHAPEREMAYQSEVILATDDPDRPFIRLKVKCVAE